MAITAIQTDWGNDPRILRIVTTDNLATITTAGYLTAQATNIASIQNGAFQWVSDDVALISYSGGESFFNYDSVNLTFIPQGSIITQVRLTAAQILGMYAAPVSIIPAPGTGKLIIVGRITGTVIYGTAQFAAGGAIGLQWGSTVHGGGAAASTTLAAATLNGYAASNTFELTPDNTDALATTSGVGIYISNATGAFTTGDSVLLLNVNYSVSNAV